MTERSKAFQLPDGIKDTKKTEIENIKKEISNLGVPIENLITSKSEIPKIHAMIKPEETLIKIIKNRRKLGNFFTSSRDYHTLIGKVKISNDKKEIVDQLFKTATKVRIPFAIYHTEYANGYLSVFGLIEYNDKDDIRPPDISLQFEMKSFAMIKPEETLIKIIKNRRKLGNFFTSSRDYHTLIGKVKISNDKKEVVDQLFKTATKVKIPFAIYHTEYANGYLSVFGLIECNNKDDISSYKHSDTNNKLTIKRASKAYAKEMKELFHKKKVEEAELKKKEEKEIKNKEKEEKEKEWQKMISEEEKARKAQLESDIIDNKINSEVTQTKIASGKNKKKHPTPIPNLTPSPDVLDDNAKDFISN
ncbi:hypothetical protein ACTA71_003386 [Dictyostelium dimigraforme]